MHSLIVIRRAAALVVVAAFAVFAVFGPPGAARAETPAGSSVESRLLVGFKAGDAAVGGLLPEGWLPVTLPRGPLAGTNLVLVLMDRHLVRDAGGAPEAVPADTAAALLVYGREDGAEGVRPFIAMVFETPPVVDVYANSVAARITREAALTSDGARKTRRESWVIAPEGGGRLAFEVAYRSGVPVWATGGESRPWSAARPDFGRIYRYDQLADPLANAATGRPLAGEASFTSDIPALAGVFDGSEQVAAIIAVPVYAREVSLP
jgi:hypothetical protein